MKSPEISNEFEGPKPCNMYDLASVLDNANLVMRVHESPDGGPYTRPTIGYDWAHIYNQENLENIRVSTHDDRVVSQVAILPSIVQTPRGDISVGGINCFATNPDFRRQGLGEAVLLDSHEKMRRNGHHIGLLTTEIYDYYRKYYWETAGRERIYAFDRGNVDLLPDLGDYEVTSDRMPFNGQIYDLSLARPIMAKRSRSMHDVVSSHRLHHSFVAHRGGELIAYLAFRDEGTPVGWDYLGDPRDVAALIRYAFKEFDDLGQTTSGRVGPALPTHEFFVRTYDGLDPDSAYLNGRGIPHTLGYIGMAIMLDAQGLWESLGITEVGLDGAPDNWEVTSGSKMLKMDDRELTRLVFGPERYPDFAPGVFPIDFYQWPLDIV